MPMVDLTVPKGRSTSEELETLAWKLTELIIKWESGTDLKGYEQASRTWVHESDLVMVGRHRRTPDNPQVYKVVASVPKGSMDDRRRAGLMRDVSMAVIAAEGIEPTDADLLRVWCIIDEVPDGNWGAGGGPLRLRDLAAMFGVKPGSARWDEVRFDQR